LLRPGNNDVANTLNVSSAANYFPARGIEKGKKKITTAIAVAISNLNNTHTKFALLRFVSL